MIDEGSPLQFVMSLRYLKLGCLLFILKLLASSGGPHSLMISIKSIKAVTVTALMQSKLNSYDSAYKNLKIAATLSIIILSELLDLYTQQPPSLFQFTLFDLTISIAGIIFLSSMESFFASVQLQLAAENKTQAAINSLASALFEDEMPQDVVPGYAVLRLDDEAHVSLLRYNSRLDKILQSSTDAPSSAAGPQGPKILALTEARLLDALTLATSEEEEDNSEGEASLRSVIMQEYANLRGIRRYEEGDLPEDHYPMLLKKIFCRGESMLEQGNQSVVSNSRPAPLLQIEVRILSEEPILLAKVSQIERKEKEADQSVQTALVSAELPPRTHTARALPGPNDGTQILEEPKVVSSDLWQGLFTQLEGSPKPNQRSDVGTQTIIWLAEPLRTISVQQTRVKQVLDESGVELGTPEFKSNETNFFPHGPLDVLPDKESDKSKLTQSSGPVSMVAQSATLVQGLKEDDQIRAHSQCNQVEQSLSNDPKLLYQLLESEKKRSREEKRRARHREKMMTLEEQDQRPTKRNKRQVDKLNASFEVEIRSKRQINSLPVPTSVKTDQIPVILSSLIMNEEQLLKSFEMKPSKSINLQKEQSIEESKRSPSQISPSQISETSSDAKPSSKSNSVDHLRAQLKNNEIFVYKIIHDLRLPTEFLANALTRLSKELKANFLNKDSKVRASESDGHRYVENARVRRALKRISKLKQLPSASQSSSIDKSVKSISKSLLMRQQQLQSVVLHEGPGLLQPLIEERKEDSRNPQTEKLPSVSFSGAKAPNRPQLENERMIEEEKQPAIQIDNQIPQHPEVDPNEPVCGEVQPMLVRYPVEQNDQNLNQMSFSGPEGNDSRESEEDSVGEEGDTATQMEKFTPVKDPARVNFTREDVKELVERKRVQSDRKPYHKYSLAFKLLMERSDIAKRVKSSNEKPVSEEQQPEEEHKSASMSRLLAEDGVQHEQQSSAPLKLLKPVEQQSDVVQDSKRKIISRGMSLPSESRSSWPEKSDSSIDGSQNSPALRVRSLGEQDNQLNSLNASSASANSIARFDDVPDSRKLMKCLLVILEEREQLVAMLNGLLAKTSQMQTEMESMGGQASMMLMLMRDLMNQAQLSNNTFTMVNGHFNCIKLIKQCINVLQNQSQHKEVNLRGPVFNDPLHKYYFLQLFSDERRYGQFILNFLSNSIKFTPKGGDVIVLLSVLTVGDDTQQDTSLVLSESAARSLKSDDLAPDKEVRAVGENDATKKTQIVSFQMIFRDTGCGISQENQQKLFMNFGKLQENQEQNKAGVGLGLSICREIILAQGGSVSIVSELGKGTDFIINLKARCLLDLSRLHQAEQRVQQCQQASSEESKQRPVDVISEESKERSSSSSSSDGNREQKYSKAFSFAQPQSGSQNYLDGQNQARESSISFGKPTFKIRANSEDEPISARKQSRCLIANDCIFLLQAYKDSLKNHFDEIFAVENGLQALEAVQSRQLDYFAVIVLDIQMPIMDGVEACQKMLSYFFRSEQDISLSAASHNSPASLSPSNRQAAEPCKAPFIYALTSETDQRQIERIRQAGFKAVFQILDQTAIQEMCSNAGVAYQFQCEEAND